MVGLRVNSQRLAGRMPALPVAGGKEVEEYGRNPAAEHVDEVVRLDVDGGTTQEDVEGQGGETEPPAVVPEEDEEDRAHAHV